MSGNDTRVGVVPGAQVEVTEFKSGQHALINAGQNANRLGARPRWLVAERNGHRWAPIEAGARRASSVTPSDYDA